MTEPTNKQELLSEIERTHQDMVRFLAAISDEEKIIPISPEGWSVKDALAHLVAWEKMTMDWLARSLKGQTVQRFIPGFTYDTPEQQEPVMLALNQHLYEQDKDRSLDDVMSDFRATHRTMLEFVSQMDEDEIFNPDRFAWREGSPALEMIGGNTYGHYPEHQTWIIEWRSRQPNYPTTKDELMRRVHERHADMEAQLASLAPDRLTAPDLDGGWSVKDSLAHIAAWEALLFDWVGKYRRGEPVIRWAPGFEVEGDNGEAQMNRFNEHLFEQNKNRPLDDVLDDYRTTFTRVIELLDGLSHAELFDADHFPGRSGRPLITFVAGDTYEHYDEHLSWIRAWLASQA